MKTVIFSLLFLFTIGIEAKNQSVNAPAKLQNKQEIEQLIQQYLKPKGVLSASYDEFKFSSNQGDLFNQYTGHSNYTSLGGDNLKFHNVYWGFSGYNISTNTTASSKMDLNLNQSHGILDTDGLYLHAMKQVFFPIFVDVFASYGRDRFKQTNIFNGDTVAALTGHAKYSGSDDTVGARTFLGYSYRSVTLQGYVTYFYARFRQPDFNVIYPEQNAAVPALTTKIGTFIEHARLYYQVTDHFSPFLSGGLLQLASRTYSRPVVDPNFIAISALPEILLAKNGYSYGVGVDYHYKELRITPSIAHSVRGSTFSDNYVGIIFELTGMS